MSWALNSKQSIPANSGSHDVALLPLHKLARDRSATLISIDLGAEETDHLGLMGFFPGVGVTAIGKAPGGDPRIYRIDQSEIALRNETARHIHVRPEEAVKP